MPRPDFHPDGRPPVSFIDEAESRAFREGVRFGGVFGSILTGLIALILYTL